MQDFDSYERSRQSWQSFGARFLGNCANVWQHSACQGDWSETFSIEQIPQNDKWDNVGTEFKLYQEDLYRSWGHIKDATQHFVCYDPKFDFDIGPTLDIIGCRNSPFSINFMRIPAGRLIPWHCDTYAWFVQSHAIPPERFQDVKRVLMFLEGWTAGHIVQFGQQVLSGWNGGDVYGWDHDCWHGGCNFGDRDMNLLLVTYLEVPDRDQGI